MKEKKGHDGVISVFGSWIISSVKNDNYVVFVGTRDGWASSIHGSVTFYKINDFKKKQFFFFFF